MNVLKLNRIPFSILYYLCFILTSKDLNRYKQETIEKRIPDPPENIIEAIVGIVGGTRRLFVEAVATMFFLAILIGLLYLILMGLFGYFTYFILGFIISSSLLNALLALIFTLVAIVWSLAIMFDNK